MQLSRQQFKNLRQVTGCRLLERNPVSPYFTKRGCRCFTHLENGIVAKGRNQMGLSCVRRNVLKKTVLANQSAPHRIQSRLAIRRNAKQTAFRRPILAFQAHRSGSRQLRETRCNEPTFFRSLPGLVYNSVWLDAHRDRTRRARLDFAGTGRYGLALCGQSVAYGTVGGIGSYRHHHNPWADAIEGETCPEKSSLTRQCAPMPSAVARTITTSE